MFPRLVLLFWTLAVTSSAGILYIDGAVESISGPNVEGVSLGSPLTAWLDYEVVSTPYPGWDPENESFEDAVRIHASMKLLHGLEDYLNGGLIGNAPGPAYWILHGFYVDTPYGVWDNMWQDYAFFLFHDDLSLRGFAIGGSWFSLYADSKYGASEWWMESGGLSPTGSRIAGAISLTEVPDLFAPMSMRLGTPVPEPGSTLLVLAILALGLAVYWRKSSVASTD